MTTIVLTPDGIYADCRLTLTMTVRDQQGQEVKIKGESDGYRKICQEPRLRLPNNQIEAYAVFGDIETAEALYRFAVAVGLEDIGNKMVALAGLRPAAPKVDSGFAWLTDAGEVMWLVFSDAGWSFNMKEPGAGHVVLGSGASLFDAAYTQSKDLLGSFLYAIARDEQSSTNVYDFYDKESGNTLRCSVPGNDGCMPTLEQFLAAQTQAEA